MDRRTFLKTGLTAAGAASFLGTEFWRRAFGAITPGAGPYGPLQPPDVNGIMLPPGFFSREIARTGSLVPGTNPPYVWHGHPDGGACFATPDGGWIYTCNAEAPAPFGGAGSVRFDAAGNVVSGVKILTGTNLNCSGGPTPWGTWLSCEEHDAGLVWECDPTGAALPIVRPALGTFKHEAAAVDPFEGKVYLTEDQSNGRFYRFTPGAYPDLSSGTLEVAKVTGAGLAPVTWLPVPNPNPVPLSGMETRNQVPDSTPFARGEGMWFDGAARTVYFSTTGDHRIWAYHTLTQSIEVLYSGSASGSPLRDPDNLTVAPSGDLYVAEDDDNLEVVVVTQDLGAASFLRVTGQTETELCGVAFNPAGNRLYFSSQRAIALGFGITYEVTGPFRAA